MKKKNLEMAITFCQLAFRYIVVPLQSFHLSYHPPGIHQVTGEYSEDSDGVPSAAHW